MIQALLFNGFTSAYWSARSFGGPYGDWQHYGSHGMMGHRLGMSTLVVFLRYWSGMAIRPVSDARPFL